MNRGREYARPLAQKITVELEKDSWQNLNPALPIQHVREQPHSIGDVTSHKSGWQTHKKNWWNEASGPSSMQSDFYHDYNDALSLCLPWQSPPIERQPLTRNAAWFDSDEQSDLSLPLYDEWHVVEHEKDQRLPKCSFCSTSGKSPIGKCMLLFSKYLWNAAALGRLKKIILCSVEYHLFCFVTTRRCTGKICTPIEGSGAVVHLQKFRDHNWPIVGVSAVVAFVSAAGFAVLWICREPSKIFCKVCDSGLKRDLISEYIYWWRRIQNSVECCICERRRFGWFDRTTPCAPSPKALPGKIPSIGTLHGRPTVGLAFAWPSCKVCDNGINWESLSDHIHWWRRIREDSFESHSFGWFDRTTPTLESATAIGAISILRISKLSCQVMILVWNGTPFLSTFIGARILNKVMTFGNVEGIDSAGLIVRRSPWT